MYGGLQIERGGRVAMDRRQFLLGAFAFVALAGCSRQEPPLVEKSVRPSPTATTPTPQAMAVAAGTTPAESLLGALLEQALTARGFAGQPIPLPSGGAYGLSEAIKAGAMAFSVGFAWTLLSPVLTNSEPPDPGDYVPTLASKLQPDGVALLQDSPADGSLVWAVAPKASTASLNDLARWKKGKKVSVPSFAVSRPDGVPGLAVAYGATLTVVKDDDPAARRRALLAGDVALAAFRACDAAEIAGLKRLDDPLGITLPDPMIVLFDDRVTDAEPSAVLAVTDTLTALGDAQLASLEKQVAQGVSPAQVAADWIASHLPPA